MSKLIVKGTIYQQSPFMGEPEVEELIRGNSDLIFGERTVYFDLKKGMRARKKGKLSIPDGYLLSLMSKIPKLYVVENEHSSHDIHNHITAHFSKYTSSFGEGSKAGIKNHLMEYIKHNKKVSDKINDLIKRTDSDNPSELLDKAIFKEKPRFLLVIDKNNDDFSDELNKALTPYNSEIIELKKFVSIRNDSKIYLFDGFEEEIIELLTKSVKNIRDVDTVICPAKELGFKNVFLKKNRWHAIRISPNMIKKIKYIAMYETKPVKAIRYIGEIKKIKPYKNTGKYEVTISRRIKLRNPLKLSEKDKGKGIAPQGPRYTNMKIIKKARRLRDLL